MNHVKECVKRCGITHFLTYADNFAIGYFKKQVRAARCGGQLASHRRAAVTYPRSGLAGLLQAHFDAAGAVARLHQGL